MTTPNDPFPTDENLDELHADHDTTFPAVEDEPTEDEPGGDAPEGSASQDAAPMAGDPDLQAGHLGE